MDAPVPSHLQADRPRVSSLSASAIPPRGASPPDMRALVIPLALYAAAFAIFWPQGISVNDESSYVRAAVAFAHGSTTTPVRDGLTGMTGRVLPGAYPPGTALLMSPFVGIAGSAAAPLASLLCWMGTALLLARWLLGEGRSPIFALLYLGYLPALVLGRVSMSDVPSGLVVCAAQMLLFVRPANGASRPSSRSDFAAGLLSGVSLLFRETNALFVAPLILGIFLRREGRSRPILLGGLAGICLRLLGAWLAFGNAFFAKEHGYGWSLHWALAHLPLYLGALLLLAPGGLVAAVLYRGPRRAEVLATVLLVLCFFLAYGYSGEESGFFKQLVLGPRYFIPLIPLLAVASAEALPRLWREWGSLGGARLPGLLALAWVVCVSAASAAVHPVLWRFQRDQGELARQLCASTRSGVALVLDQVRVEKYLASCAEARSPVDFGMLQPEQLPSLVARDGAADVVLFERGDSEFHRLRNLQDARWVASAARLCKLSTVSDTRHGEVRLLIARATRCSAATTR